MIISRSVPALRACQSHQEHLGVLEDPGIQEVQQLPALLSRLRGPEDERVWECYNQLRLTRYEALLERDVCEGATWFAAYAFNLQQVLRGPEHQRHRPYQGHPADKQQGFRFTGSSF